jgi:hypothetical protein
MGQTNGMEGERIGGQRCVGLEFSIQEYRKRRKNLEDSNRGRISVKKKRMKLIRR